MTLVRTKDRDVITIGNFSFAAGEVELISVGSVPFSLLRCIQEEEHGVQEYFEYNLSMGMISEEDFTFIMSVTSEELIEVWGKITQATLREIGSDAIDIDLRNATGISLEDEALVDRFADILNGMPTANPPEPSEVPDEDEDRGEDDGLAAV